jgi:uncharacterized membrane protein
MVRPLIAPMAVGAARARHGALFALGSGRWLTKAPMSMVVFLANQLLMYFCVCRF